MKFSQHVRCTNKLKLYIGEDKAVIISYTMEIILQNILQRLGMNSQEEPYNKYTDMQFQVEMNVEALNTIYLVNYASRFQCTNNTILTTEKFCGVAVSNVYSFFMVFRFFNGLFRFCSYHLRHGCFVYFISTL